MLELVAATENGRWAENTCTTTGRTYYCNDVTGESTWEQPAELAPSHFDDEDEDAALAAATKRAPRSTSRDAVHLIDGNTDTLWTENIDPTTGETYYFNTLTQESTWELPAELSTIRTPSTAAPEQVNMTRTSPSRHSRRVSILARTTPVQVATFQIPQCGKDGAAWAAGYPFTLIINGENTDMCCPSTTSKVPGDDVEVVVSGQGSVHIFSRNTAKREFERRHTVDLPAAGEGYPEQELDTFMRTWDGRTKPLDWLCECPCSEWKDKSRAQQIVCAASTPLWFPVIFVCAIPVLFFTCAARSSSSSSGSASRQSLNTSGGAAGEH